MFSLLPVRLCHKIEWTCMVTTQELVKRCLSRQFHLESWGGDPGPRPGPELSPMPLLSLHWGEWIYLQALAGSEDCPLGGDMFTITAPKRGILLKKTENKKTNKKKNPKTRRRTCPSVCRGATHTPFWLQVWGHSSPYTGLCFLSNKPIQTWLPFPILKITLTPRDECTS